MAQQPSSSPTWHRAPSSPASPNPSYGSGNPASPSSALAPMRHRESSGSPYRVPIVPNRPPVGYAEAAYANGSYSGHQRAPSAGMSMREFGAGLSIGDSPSASAARQQLPLQPPASSPMQPYQVSASASSGSIGQGRRTLPTPPSIRSSASYSEGPPPPPRPQGARALPSLPPAGPRSPSGRFAGDAPVPPPRPLPAPTSFTPPSQPPQLIASLSPPPPHMSPPLIRNAAERLQNPGITLQDSPSTYEPTSPGYFRSGPSRNPSLAQSSSTTFSRQPTSASHTTTSETQPTSHSPSVEDHDWKAILDSFGEGDEPRGEGTAVTLRPPSSPGLSTEIDGRGTPTPSNPFLGTANFGNLSIEPRLRVVSDMSSRSYDPSLPLTPRLAPQADLNHRPGLIDGPGSSASVHFPVPLPHTGSHSAPEGSHTGHGSSSDHVEALRPVSTTNRDDAVQRDTSVTSSLNPASISSDARRSYELSPSWAQQARTPALWVQTKLQIHQSHRAELDDDASYRHGTEEEDEEWDDEEDLEVEAIRFFQPAFLSEAAVQLSLRVERRRQTKAGIAWVGSFTGRDIVTSIQSFLPPFTRTGPSDRRFALITAQSLQNQLWFVEVDWDIKPLRDSSEDVFRFMGEMESMGATTDSGMTSELPSGLMTMATKCYSPSCPGDPSCYSPRCPYRVLPDSFLGRPTPTPVQTPNVNKEEDWQDNVDPLILHGLTPEQINRQTIIRQAVQSEVQYEADLDALQRLFIDGLREADPPIISPSFRCETFVREVFGNVAELHEACRRLIEHFAIRERESPQRPLLLSVGDIFLQAAADFRMVYPDYTGNLPNAENVLRKETEENPAFRLYCERIVRENDRRRDIKHLIARPSTQLQRYPAVLEAILNATPEDDPDRDFLVEALSSIQNLSAISQLKLFHASKGRGPAGKMQWFDLVPENVRNGMEKKEQKRQMHIWELIQGEMEYVADLETIDELFVQTIRDPPVRNIIERPRIEIFLDDAFHNYRSLLDVHSRLLENLQHRQLEQHPNFGMVSDLILDAALNWQDAYMEYVTHYPIAKAKVQEEAVRNKAFSEFLDVCLKDPRSNRQDIYHFIYRPIPRLLRYNLLLTDILSALKAVGPKDHPDLETIPQIMELIADLGKATQKGVAVNEAKVELWNFQSNLNPGRLSSRVVKDLDLLNPMRELIHRAKVFRQPEGAMSSSWVELTVLLFDHYLVLTKPERQSKSSRRENGETRYVVNRRPIPLELLSLGNFSDAPRNRNNRIFSVGTSHDQDSANPDTTSGDSRTVWPFSISFIGQGQLGGQYTFWTDSFAARAEWQEKLLHAKVLRNEVNDANRVFELTPLSEGTFWMAPGYGVTAKQEEFFTGRVTCSCPFRTTDGRRLVAVGCEEGVWIGVRGEQFTLRKVLHDKKVTGIAVLEEFGIFMILADKVLWAYELELLVPTSQTLQPRKVTAQRISQQGGGVMWFSVGQLRGRTLVVFMRRKGIDSLFRVLEPILGRTAEDARQRRPFGGFLQQRSDWFRLFKDFFIPVDAMGVHFLKHKIAIVCTKQFEIMDLTDLKGGTIPIFDPAKTRDRPLLADMQRKVEGAKPLAMFRSTETEFLLCYDSFGIYVDRHGEPNRDCQPIEWEGRPDSVAFHPPYVLLVSAPFVEVRHIDNAKLLQIYTGGDIRLTWDGTGGMANPVDDNPGPHGYGDETSSQEPRVHICQRPETQTRPRGITQGIGQHVYELTPTLALNNPLLNPVHTHDSNYFPPAPPMVNRASSVITNTSDGYSYSGGLNGFTPASERSWN